MILTLKSSLGKALSLASILGQRPQVLAFLPALVLGSFWLGGELLLLVTALGIPVLMAFAEQRDGMATSAHNDKLEDELDTVLSIARRKALKTVCYMVEIDGHSAILDRFGSSAMTHIMAQTQARLKRAVRNQDRVRVLNENLLAVIIAPTHQLDHPTALNLAGRLQSAVEEPLAVDAANIYISASIGFCTSDTLSNPAGADLADATTLALRDAQRHAPSGLRAFSRDLTIADKAPSHLTQEIEAAFEQGQIKAWFQPQVSTETGMVTGFEALARWQHPSRGMIPPAEFLPDLERSGHIERLGEVILNDALIAMSKWDSLGLTIPRVGVNFGSDELRNPKLVESVAWALDRFDIAAHRLAIEILETVVSTSPDDTISSNIRDLANLGCHIDLDDFGTGHTSISSIRRFAIQRLKIDRSFVVKVDQDPDQKDMIAAILVMAERLGLDTIAEGVETAGEHAMLAQLGCGHVQGYGIARPMPFERTIEWVEAHVQKVQKPPSIGRRTG
jgi:predicted signal transduction protein with EAL and GGDEF domain